MIVQEILTHRSNNTDQFDRILVDLCEMILSGQRQDPDYYGLVAACVIDPDGKSVQGINHAVKNGQRVHAERAAVMNYQRQYGKLPNNSIMITTLSPCTETDGHMARERAGISCSELMDDLNIRRVYCGYIDPTQPHLRHDDFDCVATQNEKIQHVCQEIANCFLKESGAMDPANYRGESIDENLADNNDPVKFDVHTPDNFSSGFQIKLTVHGKQVGHFNFVRDPATDDVTNEVEVESRFQGQGYGKLLLLKAIEIANSHRLDFQQDIRGITDAQQNVYDSLENAGLIVTPGDGFWFLTAQGEQELAPLTENFADGKVKGKSRPGRVKRAGASCSGSVTDLRARAQRASGERARMYHWCANMKSGKKK